MGSLRNQLQPAVDRAIALHQAGRVGEAEGIYRKVLQQDPRNPDALHLLGLIHHHNGDPATAIDLMTRAVRQEPAVALYRMNLAKAYRAAGLPAEAVAAAQRAVDLSPPTFVEAQVELASCLTGAGRAADAERVARNAVRVAPSSPEARSALGNALADQGQIDEAIAEYQVALRLRPDFAEAASNLGEALRKVGRYDEAERLLLAAAQLAPNVAEPHFNLSLIRLVRGDLTRGWPGYEWRWRQIGVRPRAFAQPQWDGSMLHGKSILLYAEQGLGDTIQFVRYATLVARERAAGRVIVECDAALASLVATIEGVSDVRVKGAALPPFDVQCPLVSLPLKFGTTIQTIPGRAPYVSVDPARAVRWREELKLSQGVRNVGLVWAGSAVHKNDRNRSMRLGDLASLATVEDVRWISLQVGPASEQLRAPPPGLMIEEVGSRLTDFSDTAALVTELDLLISVDTSPAHVAGALGRPVWLLLPRVPDFRWLLDRADSPWYPSMRLFRQPAAGAWEPVVRAVAEALRGA
ncbi:MAG TPA: tetratricopeptide repeat-containing glycosyltransferase family protein [Tepidisphaeraceae bacterium]|nr:tetratricopeptide repeat-containing glycosyltransferase family protein [Tepidisphaeraceae bacterium]